MLQRIFIVPQHCSMPNSSVLCKGKPDHVPRETHASGQIMPRDSKPKMELALSPSNSPTAHHAKTRIVWSPRLGAFLTDFLIPFFDNHRQSLSHQPSRWRRNAPELWSAPTVAAYVNHTPSNTLVSRISALLSVGKFSVQSGRGFRVKHRR